MIRADDTPRWPDGHPQLPWCEQGGDYALAATIGTNRINQQNLRNSTAPSQIPFGSGFAAPLLLRLLCWIPDKLALNTSLAAPVLWVA
jgi:hypothetical protein